MSRKRFVDSTLVTGFPSYTAKRMLLKLIAADPKESVFILVRDKYSTDAEEFVGSMSPTDSKRCSVLVGNVGSEQRMDFTVLGDAVNVADRLQGLAEGGQILCGAQTRSLAGPRFAFDEGRVLPLKGRKQPERAFLLLDGP